MKPYGYMNVYADGRKEFHYDVDNASVSNIPLYESIHDLSDEEITVIATQGRSDLTIPAHISFARAILKKASEK